MTANNNDSPKHAPESGEPTEAGRSRGKVKDEGSRSSPKIQQSAGAKTDNKGRVGEDLESGRHESTAQ